MSAALQVWPLGQAGYDRMTYPGPGGLAQREMGLSGHNQQWWLLPKGGTV